MIKPGYVRTVKSEIREYCGESEIDFDFDLIITMVEGLPYDVSSIDDIENDDFLTIIETAEMPL